MDIDLLHPDPAEEGQAQAEAVDPGPELVLHGREVPGLPPDHDGLLARADGCALRQLQRHALPADWRHCAAHGGLLLPQEGGVRATGCYELTRGICDSVECA